MTFLETAIDERLVTDTEKSVFEALPRLATAGKAGRDKCAVQIADVMGMPGEFQRYLSGPAPDRLARIDHLLKVFRENIELLIHKTWVEKSEEKPKARLLEDLGTFERDFRNGAVAPSLKRFVTLANSIASLLFGHQSRAEDFLAYCFRIDPKFGLFFWYVGELEKQAHEGKYEDDLLTVETLIGIYVLSSF
jgi:hypothetical protein